MENLFKRYFYQKQNKTKKYRHKKINLKMENKMEK